MTHRPTLLSLPFLLLVALSGCGNRGDNGTAIPRPVAYPHIEVADSSFRSIDAAGLRLMVNSNATVNQSPRDDGAWIDISYPLFSNPQLHLTLTRCDAGRIEAVLANRREREALNLGGQRYELTELVTPGGWNCTMSVARGSLTTPVQILAYDASSVLSGALTLMLPDSLASDPQMAAPIIDMVERDLIVLMKGLGDE